MSITIRKISDFIEYLILLLTIFKLNTKSCSEIHIKQNFSNIIYQSVINPMCIYRYILHIALFTELIYYTMIPGRNIDQYVNNPIIFYR